MKIQFAVLAFGMGILYSVSQGSAAPKINYNPQVEIQKTIDDFKAKFNPTQCTAKSFATGNYQCLLDAISLQKESNQKLKNILESAYSGKEGFNKLNNDKIESKESQGKIRPKDRDLAAIDQQYSLVGFLIGACETRAGTFIGSSSTPKADAQREFQSKLADDSKNTKAVEFRDCLERGKQFLSNSKNNLPASTSTYLSTYLNQVDMVKYKYQWAQELCDPQMKLEKPVKRSKAVADRSLEAVMNCWEYAGRTLAPYSKELKAHFSNFKTDCQKEDFRPNEKQKISNECAAYCDQQVREGKITDSDTGRGGCYWPCVKDPVSDLIWACYGKKVRGVSNFINSISKDFSINSGHVSDGVPGTSEAAPITLESD